MADVLAGYAVAGLGNGRALPWLLAADRLPLRRRRGPERLLRSPARCGRAAGAAHPERPGPGRARGGLGAALLVAGVASAAQATRPAVAIALRHCGARRAVRCVGEAPGRLRPREHGALPRAEPGAGDGGRPGHNLGTLAARAAILCIYRRGDGGQPWRSPRRETRGRGAGSDIVDRRGGRAGGDRGPASGPRRRSRQSALDDRAGMAGVAAVLAAFTGTRAPR